MFNPFKHLRALLPSTRRRKLPALVYTGGKPASASYDWDGAVRPTPLRGTGGRRKAFWLAPIRGALAAALCAVPAAAFPPPSDYVANVDAKLHAQRVELVRAAWCATHHPSEWADFAPGAVYESSGNDRISLRPNLGGRSIQRKRAAEHILTTPRYAILVLRAYYPGV